MAIVSGEWLSKEGLTYLWSKLKTIFTKQEETNVVVNAGAKNLLKNVGTTTTHRGVTFTVNEDGSVMANGTNDGTGASLIHINTQSTLALDNGEYILSGCPTGGSSTGYMMDATRSLGSSLKDIGDGISFRVGGDYTVNEFRIVISRNTTVNNLTFYPMIRRAEITDATFQPYALPNPTLTPAVIKAVDDGAKNILRITKSSGVMNTATIDIANDGSIHISGQPTSNGAYVVSSGIDLTIPDNIYIMSAGPEAGDIKFTLSLRIKGTSTYVDLYHAESRILPAGTYDRVHIYLYSDTVYDTTIYPMICKKSEWDISQAYQPYALPNPTLTPAAIKAVDEGAKNLLKIGFTDRTTPEPTVVKTADGTGFVVNGARSSTSSSVLIYDIATGQPSGLLTRAEIPAGSYYISGTGNAKLYLQVVAHNGTSQQVLIATSGGGIFEYTTDQKTDYPYVTVRLATDGKASYDNLTIYPMLCTAADWAVSKKFVPYAPTNRQLYDSMCRANVTLPSDADLDKIKTHGFYHGQGENITHRPVSGSYNFTLMVIESGEFIIQVFKQLNSAGDPYIFVRRFYIWNTSWDSWYQFGSMDNIYGSGTLIPDNANLNSDTYLVPGKYYGNNSAGNTVSGMPIPNRNMHITLTVMQVSSSFTVHIFRSMANSQDPYTYYRKKLSGQEWGNWYRITAEEIVP